MKKILATVRECICVRTVLMAINGTISLLGSVAWAICYLNKVPMSGYWEGVTVVALGNILLNTHFYWDTLVKFVELIRKED